MRSFASEARQAPPEGSRGRGRRSPHAETRSRSGVRSRSSKRRVSRSALVAARDHILDDRPDRLVDIFRDLALGAKEIRKGARKVRPPRVEPLRHQAGPASICGLGRLSASQTGPMSFICISMHSTSIWIAPPSAKNKVAVPDGASRSSKVMARSSRMTSGREGLMPARRGRGHPFEMQPSQPTAGRLLRPALPVEPTTDDGKAVLPGQVGDVPHADDARPAGGRK